MKKVFAIFAVAAAVLMVSCGGNKTNKPAEAEEATEVVVDEVVVDEVDTVDVDALVEQAEQAAAQALEQAGMTAEEAAAAVKAAADAAQAELNK